MPAPRRSRSAGRPDGDDYATEAAAADYTFDPATGNIATAQLDGATARYLRLTVSANSGWPAAQLADLGVFGS